ncbi:mite group 2 allergen-like Ixo r 2 isoform X3 [Rhipicephalus sanguineus]|uniref:mite group 2 allergen-like Ixo r 2 isoform X3 n=1 Tax=Rhipicephalus sanguineus TaxID=34632 RepID=UPI001892FADA|nr:mite group 2 allergen-like Ixo r 2 isoform X3 [Rhipicephalus sanguineus]
MIVGAAHFFEMCSTMTSFLILSGAFVMTTAQRKIRFENCTEGGESIQSFVVTPCSSDPCVVPIGSGINISFELISSVERDACKLTNTACPVSEGQLVRGTVPVHVYSFLPPMTVVTIWRVYGDKGLMACGTTNVTISRI